MEPCYCRQYWDGTFSPANFYTFSPANFSPVLRLLTCSFFLADFSHAVLGWHRPGLPNSRKKNNQWNHGGFATTSTRLPLNAKFTENKNAQRNRGKNLSKKMQSSLKTKMINARTAYNMRTSRKKGAPGGRRAR